MVVLVGVLTLAVGATAGALLSPRVLDADAIARARVDAKPEVHGLLGTEEYDEEVRSSTVFQAEAGLSFFHTHGMGLGLVVLFSATVIATAVPWRRARGILYGLLTVGGLFPLGYLAYAVAVLELGRYEGVTLVERWILTPLGTSTIAALAGLAILLLAAAGRPPEEP